MNYTEDELFTAMLHALYGQANDLVKLLAPSGTQATLKGVKE